MSGLTDEMRAEMQAITAGLSGTRVGNSGSRHFQYNGEEVVEVDRPSAIVGHSMFPYKSTTMAVDPSEVPEVQEQLRKQGLFVEFDREGRPEITSTKQQGELAKAMGMKTGRDGYGHINSHGQFETSGRQRGDEIKEARAKIRKAIDKLEAMPEEVPTSAVEAVLDEYDIVPNAENTG